MSLLKIFKFLHNAKEPHFISVDYEIYKKWSWVINLIIFFNKNYKICSIYRKKYKHLRNVVIVGLKWNGKNVKRRTSGFAKEFVKSHKNAKCIYCEKKLDIQNATTDHILSISKGGNNCQVNLIVCCFDCNNQRGNLDFLTFLKSKNFKYKDAKVVFI